MSNFLEDFFEEEKKKIKPVLLSQFVKIAIHHGDEVWKYLLLLDVLNISVTSRLTAGRLGISVNEIQRFLSSDDRISHIGRFRLSFESNVSLGILRRLLYRVVIGNEGILSIDAVSGRVVVDIGSAFKDKNAYLVEPVPFTEEEGEDNAISLSSPGDAEGDTDASDQRIFKYLEVASYDEYDDFNPRHPMPRDKTHRRGDSYFNSDVELVAMEALAGMDLSSIAAMALQAEGMLSSSSPRGHRSSRANRQISPRKSIEQITTEAAEALNAPEEE